MKLYASTTSPYARKVRILLQEQGIAHQFIAESPADPESNVARLNPLGKVPLLQLDNGEVLFNSPMIVEYIDAVAGKPMIPVELEQRWRVQRWHALADGIMDAVIVRMLELRRAPESRDVAIISKQEHKVEAALQYADQQMRDLDADFLCCDYLTIADVAFSVALDYINLRYSHNWADKHLRLAAWFTVINQRQSFQQTLP